VLKKPLSVPDPLGQESNPAEDEPIPKRQVVSLRPRWTLSMIAM
jgi:hypothetical protein